MITHEGDGHGDIALSLSGETPGGGRWFQSWTVCECGLAGLRTRLGEAQHESISDAGAVADMASHARDHPGSVHRL